MQSATFASILIIPALFRMDNRIVRMRTGERQIDLVIVRVSTASGQPLITLP